MAGSILNYQWNKQQWHEGSEKWKPTVSLYLPWDCHSPAPHTLSLEEPWVNVAKLFGSRSFYKGMEKLTTYGCKFQLQISIFLNFTIYTILRTLVVLKSSNSCQFQLFDHFCILWIVASNIFQGKIPKIS